MVLAQATALSSERSLLDVRNRRLAAVDQLLKNIAGRWNAPLELMQVAWPTTTATMPPGSTRTTGATRRLAQFQ